MNWASDCFCFFVVSLLTVMAPVIEHANLLQWTYNKAQRLLEVNSPIILDTLIVGSNQSLLCPIAGFRKGRGTRNQIANIHWIMEKAREFQKNICFIDYPKAFDCVDHNKLWKTLEEMGMPDHLDCLLRNLYADQEAIVGNGHETVDWLQIRKGFWQSCLFSSCLFNLHAEYTMQNVKLDESQARVKMARKISTTSDM